MKIYLVGGAVRDKLLGLPVKERDWVVVGATVEDMLKLGYKQVGKEFPVFLHPKTAEEYALARMERKVSPGYKGFTVDTSPEVSLEDDLVRRDLTINAMAESADGQLIDPYHGKDDLAHKVLRHVSLAFAEDPVRILRVGRFLARYAHMGFQVAAATTALMCEMVDAGEVDALVAERVWKELERALGEKNPEQFFELLNACGALPILFPNLDINSAGIQALIAAEKLSTDTTVRFAALLHDHSDEAVNTLCKRYRVPSSYQELAILTSRHYEIVLQQAPFTVDDLANLFQSIDIFRRTDRFKKFLDVCEAIAISKGMIFDRTSLESCAKVVANDNFGDFIQTATAKSMSGEEIGKRLKEMRRQKIDAWLKSKK